MWLAQLIFYVDAALLVGAAFAVIISRNPVTSALYLVLAFVASAGLWLMLEAEFLALVLVFVYVGAVMTLFLFVIMMLNLNFKQLKVGFVRYMPLCLIIVGLMIALMVFALSPDRFGTFAPVLHDANYSNIRELGQVLYTEYAFPFEMAAVLLLVAIVAAIGLTHFGGKPKRKVQEISQQLTVDPRDRVKLVDIPSQHHEDTL